MAAQGKLPLIQQAMAKAQAKKRLPRVPANPIGGDSQLNLSIGKQLIQKLGQKRPRRGAEIEYVKNIIGSSMDQSPARSRGSSFANYPRKVIRLAQGASPMSNKLFTQL